MAKHTLVCRTLIIGTSDLYLCAHDVSFYYAPRSPLFGCVSEHIGDRHSGITRNRSLRGSHRAFWRQTPIAHSVCELRTQTRKRFAQPSLRVMQSPITRRLSERSNDRRVPTMQPQPRPDPEEQPTPLGGEFLNSNEASQLRPAPIRRVTGCPHS